MNAIWRLIALILVAFIACVLLTALLCSVKATDIVAGDTVELTAVFRDSSGVAVAPDSARLVVLCDNAVVDTSQTLGATGVRVLGGYANPLLVAEYTVPAAASDTARYSFYLDCLGDDAGLADMIPCSPSTVRLRSTDWFAVRASATMDTLTAAQGGLITSGETNVTDARVFATTTSTFAPEDIVAMAYTLEGDYRLWFPIDAVAADTVWVWAWKQGVWLTTGTQVVVD